MLGIEEIAPITAIGGGKPVVLYEYRDEEPEDDLAACD